MMDYYLLKQSSKMKNVINIIELDNMIYSPIMNHDKFKQLKKTAVAYTRYEQYQEIPDIIASPTYMVSDELRRVLKMYDDSIEFKAVQVFPEKIEYVKEAAKVYWVYDCKEEDCLHKDVRKLPNGELSEVILDMRKLTGKDVLRVKGMLDNKLVISLAVAESIARRNMYGVEFEKVTVR